MATGETDLHDMIRDSVQDLAADFPREYWRECVENHEFPHEYWDALAEAGWLGVAIPEEYGVRKSRNDFRSPSEIEDF